MIPGTRLAAEVLGAMSWKDVLKADLAVKAAAAGAKPARPPKIKRAAKAGAQEPTPAVEGKRKARASSPVFVKLPRLPQKPRDLRAAAGFAPVVPGPGQPAAESRKSKRKPTRIGGIIQSRDSRQSISCSVRDLSATGALLSLVVGGRREAAVRQNDVPTRFWLTIKQDRMQVECTVVRRICADEIAVEFLSAPRFY